MRLTQIQDIGGCRAIVSTNEHLKELVNIIASRDKIHSSRGVKHKLVFEKNYIEEPKASGYRGVHLVYRYFSDKTSDYNSLKIEIQFRTILQHAWATAVETVGIFIGQALKSSIGQKEWLLYFALASSVMAFHEGTPQVPGLTHSSDELSRQLRELSSTLDVPGHLDAYGTAMEIFGEEDLSGMHYYLLILDPDNSSITIRSYTQGQYEKASTDYLEVEKEIAGKNSDAVLVSADSITTLKKAYPNYFADTQTFLSSLAQIIA